MRTYALIGNPNCGKTTLFNELTGTSQHVGNWPGVTVEKKVGHLKHEYGDADIVDLPGIYSLTSYSIEERVSRAFIIDERPDVVIDIVEATNIERNLFLMCQIAELGVPLVVAVNMMDEAEKAGDKIDCKALSEHIGIPVMPITAVTGEGVIELMHTVGMHKLMKEVSHEADSPFHEGEDEHGHGFQDSEDPLRHRLEHHTDVEGRTNALVAAYKYHNHYKGPETFQPTGDHPLTEEQETDNANRRYAFIKKVINASVEKGHAVNEVNRSDRADKIFTNRFLGIPLFLLIMFFMFHCTFSDDFLGLSAFGIGPIPSPGVWLQGLAQSLVDIVTTALTPIFTPDTWVYGLVINGICGGVGAVVSFLPQICVLFFFLTLLEDVGYMARAAFIMDRFLRIFGLSGKSFVPMLMGFGCNVPAMMACRTMESENDRKITLFLVPFMSCGARAPIFLVFATAFFPDNADVIVFGLYILGIVLAIFTGWLLKTVFFKGKTTPLIIELPRYRAPRFKSLGLALWGTIKDYLQRAGTIIFVMSIAIWFLSNFGFGADGFGMVDIEDSLLSVAGAFIAPVFGPLGFGIWPAAVALITGFIAKESVIGTLGVLAGSNSDGGSGLSLSVLQGLGFTPAAGFSFMVFSLLYLPCLATVATLKRESNSWAWTIGQGCYALVVAWICSFIAYHLALVIGV
ncbi:MAG: ferrous iron transport protein B [Eggerthellaceae bacterium]|jgi:ferrous iron transport protein B|nr:ferrous iron transport protein B [Eggerthellaceae bacterium]MCH4221315.1 ferrous iron transport protein B [Eggerthellaceae bacterium]